LSLASPAHGTPLKSAAAASQAGSTYNGIDYHGGPVMNDPQGTNVYLIWYGSWSNNTEPAILTDFISNLGGTAYFNITSSYYDFNKFGGGVKDPVVNRVNFMGSITDNYSLGTNLTDNNVAQIVGSTHACEYYAGRRKVRQSHVRLEQRRHPGRRYYVGVQCRGVSERTSF
jgi:hypothetical protein